MRTAVNAIEDFFGTAVAPRLAQAVEKASPERLAQFADHYRAFIASAAVPLRDVAELRPYVQVHRIDAARHGLEAVTPVDFDDLEAARRAVGALRLHLLYCHSVAFDNPLVYILDYFRGEDDDSFETARRRLANYLRFLSDLRSLVDAGIVVLLEQDFQFRLGEKPLKPSDVAAHRLMRAADLSDLPAIQATGRSLVTRQPEFAAFLVRFASETLQIGLRASNRHDGNLDLYLPARYYEPVLEWLVQVSSPTTRDIRERELILLRELLSIEVPDLSALSMSDIVTIRNGPEFSLWRSKLSRAMERVQGLRANLLNRDRAASAIVREEFVEAERELRGRIGNSRFLSDARRGLLTFGLGALGSVGAGLLIPPVAPAALVGTTATTALSLLWSYVASRRKASSDALFHHYLLFSGSRRAT